MLGHGNDLVLVDPAPYHHVDLGLREAGGLRGSNAVEHGGNRDVGITHALEGIIAQAVQADSDPSQPGILQAARFLGQQDRIGGERNLDRFAFGGIETGEFFDQLFDAATQQGLAPGQADLVNAQPDEDARQTLNFLEGEQFGTR